MRISKLRILNYRSIKDSGELEPTKLFALIGKNNSGKSTIIRAIQAVWGHDDAKISADDFHKGAKDLIEIFIMLTDIYTSVPDKYFNKDKDIDIRFTCDRNSKEKYYINGTAVPTKDMKALLPELLVIPAIRNPVNESTGGSKSFMKQLITLILKEQSGGESRQDETATEQTSLGEKRLCNASDEEIETYLKQRRNNQILGLSKNVNEYFRKIVDLDNLSVEINAEGDLSKVIAGYRTRVINQDLKELEEGINLLSCGTGIQSMFILALLQTYADMTKNTDSILLVEEPEVYLHPAYQRQMFRALRSIASDNQVIYTTHSAIMIGELWADKSIRLVALSNGETMITAINIDEVTRELGIRYDDVLNPSVLVFVEGATDIEFYRAIVIQLYPQFKDSIDRSIKFIDSDGYRNIDSYAYMKIINSQNVEAQYYIIADSDGIDATVRRNELHKSIESRVHLKLSEEEVSNRVLILHEYAIESYFLSADILNKAFPSINKDSLKHMLTLYKEKYNASMKTMWAKGELDEFRQYFNPKLLFSERFKNQRKKEIFASKYDNDKNFLSTRDTLIKCCSELKSQRISLIDKILQFVDVKETEFSDIRGIVDAIVKPMLTAK